MSTVASPPNIDAAVGPLSGKLTLITGAGSGIGRAAAQLADRDGAVVVLVDVNLDTASDTLDTLTKNRDSFATKCDVSQKSDVQKLAQDIFEKFKKYPETVIHCAGIKKTTSGVADDTEEYYDQVMAVNMKGTFLINQTFILHMKHSAIRGSIVNLASGCMHGNWVAPAYSASKAGVVGLTLALSKEFASSGIRVNAVSPGPVDTPMVLTEPCDLNQIPFKRMADPKEIAEVCVFLASERSSYMTGSIVDVHGGCFIPPPKPNNSTA